MTNFSSTWTDQFSEGKALWSRRTHHARPPASTISIRRRLHGHAVVDQIQAAGQPRLQKYCGSLFFLAGTLLVVSICFLLGVIPDATGGFSAVSDTTRGATISSRICSLPAGLTQHRPLKIKLHRIESEPACMRAELFNALGVTCLGEGDTSGATECFRKAVSADPLLVAAHNNLGTTMLQRGDLVGARSAFTSTLELQPGNAYAAQQLVNLGKR